MTMSPEEADRFAFVHELITRQLEGTATEQEQQQLQDAVTSDPNVRREYIRHMQEVTHITSRLVAPRPGQEFSKSSVLGQTCSTGPLPPSDAEPAITSDALTPAPHRPLGVSFLGVAASLAIAATLLLAVSIPFWMSDGRNDQNTIASKPPSTGQPSDKTAALHGTEVATLVECTNVVWDSRSNAVNELSRVGIGQNISFHRGRIKLVFDSGVETLVLAPCYLNIQDHNRVYCTYGRITAKASAGGKGFAIETPVARVTDLGTEFGIAISESGETEVAVFEGEVDIELGAPDARKTQNSQTKREHLVQGQATRVDHSGRSKRVFSIDNQRMPGVRDLAPMHHDEPVIAAVRDNISERHPESRMFYRIVHAGLREDSRAFVDRTHQWNGLDEDGMPRELLGADYVMPFNDDKFAGDLKVRVAIARPATVYVFFSNNTKVPDWLASGFIDTGLDIGLDEGANRYKPSKRVAAGPGKSIDNTFSIWERDVQSPQELELGSFERPVEFKRGYNMYGIAAVAK
ncbi:FecR domain-containing protein [Rhodopirellula sallentina]|uniref:FecR protein n=1 Tax=Rhodopirellula sallentina SM41 TaxID=1263870 RepID=M5U8Z0_9BACT|nr:FecR domain-containing protein [Rhodopirellula sallentina]EMI57724.1 FecR protein [Rhodopirellula sallentina SM41]